SFTAVNITEINSVRPNTILRHHLSLSLPAPLAVVTVIFPVAKEN
ncbi:hypothetical protein A2U01_0057116, partial [Trifolium medium]|nr:hypothetical protein [Trifolium medium]